ncbi:hypothetical protein NVP1135O_65 [Vibrio phage 1.135.O._10N.222.54.B6]|nr:hypothetical protein NVP1135O_65 [Vibrio phage 1.135.O._10N.222.54.B6]
MKNKKVKQMICDVMTNKFEQKFCWNYYGLMAEYDDPFRNGLMVWFEFENPKFMRKVSLTADQLRGK